MMRQPRRRLRLPLLPRRGLIEKQRHHRRVKRRPKSRRAKPRKPGGNTSRSNLRDQNQPRTTAPAGNARTARRNPIAIPSGRLARRSAAGRAVAAETVAVTGGVMPTRSGAIGAIQGQTASTNLPPAEKVATSASRGGSAKRTRRRNPSGSVAATVVVAEAAVVAASNASPASVIRRSRCLRAWRPLITARCPMPSVSRI